MKPINKLLKLVTFSIFTAWMSHLYAADLNSPVGYWKTIDDVSGKPKSIVSIYANADQTLSGKVLKIFPKPGENQNKVCDACKGDKHNQRIVGMVILAGMKRTGDHWGEGNILDPKNGKTYHCSFKLIAAGTKLAVRGYIGIPILGRTQVWERIAKP